jgi:hypothetical protein
LEFEVFLIELRNEVSFLFLKVNLELSAKLHLGDVVLFCDLFLEIYGVADYRNCRKKVENRLWKFGVLTSVKIV